MHVGWLYGKDCHTERRVLTMRISGLWLSMLGNAFSNTEALSLISNNSEYKFLDPNYTDFKKTEKKGIKNQKLDSNRVISHSSPFLITSTITLPAQILIRLGNNGYHSKPGSLRNNLVAHFTNVQGHAISHRHNECKFF